jgi:hypothetical protein
MWPRRKADRLLEEMIRENGLAETGAQPQPRRFSLFGRKRKPVPFTAEPTAKSRDRRSDLTVAALGVTLGLICALFPWYIFFNPDEFGVRAMKFGGSGMGTEPIVLGAQPDRIGAPVASQDIPPMEIDLRTTGTAAKEPEEEDTEGTPDLAEQPFPAPVASFRLVQIANGLAMLEDDTGLFIVEPGSMLPDSTRVKTIEQRDGRLVLVTESGVVLEIEK